MCGVSCIQDCYIPCFVLSCICFFMFSSFSFMSCVFFPCKTLNDSSFPLCSVVITLPKWIIKKFLNRSGLKLESAYTAINGVLVLLFEPKGWNGSLALERLKIFCANHKYSLDCGKMICSLYPKHVTLEIQNGTFSGIYEALPWFTSSRIKVCWMILKKSAAKNISSIVLPHNLVQRWSQFTTVAVEKQFMLKWKEG